MRKKIFITGGHLTPAVSMIEKLAACGNWDIYYIGRNYSKFESSSQSIERKTMKRYKNVTYLTINAGKLQRFFSFSSLVSFLKIPLGFIDSLRLINTYKPDITLSFGGYVALPVCITAHAFNIPVVTHEQTMTAGSANAIIESVADKVCYSWDESPIKDDNKEILTGLPLRKAIFNVFNKFDVDITKPIIYVSGGSQGSHAINALIGPVISDLVKQYTIIHQCGSNAQFKDYEEMKKVRESLLKDQKNSYLPLTYIEDSYLGWLYNHTTLAISRSGANSVYEFSACGIPSIFIPLPFSSHNEQFKNAQVFKSNNAGIILRQNEIDSHTLLIAIEETMKNINQFRENASLLKNKILLDGDNRLLDVLLKVSS